MRRLRKERRAFGAAIAQKQAIAFMIAEMAIEIDATRLLVWEAAWKIDRGEDATREACLARNYAASMVLKVTDNAVQVLGGHGYVRDHPVEMWLATAAVCPCSKAWPWPEAARRHRIRPDVRPNGGLMIDFELSPEIRNTRRMAHALAESTMRPISREYDEREHEKPTEWLDMMWQVSRGSAVQVGGGAASKQKDPAAAGPPAARAMLSVVTIEELSWATPVST